jgi:collagenase-like PrtC family protease
VAVSANASEPASGPAEAGGEETTPRLSLGPVLYHWPAEDLRDFYFRIADEAPVDIVYVGEVVCVKRAAFFLPFAAEAIERLRRAGKDVALSTLALVGTERELDLTRDTVAAAGDLPIEANDLSAVSMAEGRPHVIGPFVNVYNEGTLSWLAARGAERVCLPAELTASAPATLARSRPVELEVQVFGRLPLAMSSRCYHARSRGLGRDGCQFVCAEDADGMTVETLDGEPFLAVNGVQVLSHTYAELSAELPAMRAMGIGVFRLWPHRLDMVEVASVYRALLEKRLEAGEAARLLGELAPGAAFSNGFYHGREGAAWVRANAE